MADFSALKTAIQANIRTNGNEEITGAILQDILLSMVSTMGDGAINALADALQAEITNRQNAVSGEATARADADSELSGRINLVSQAVTAIITRLNEGYLYAGIATPSTNPGTPTGKVFYIALQSGTYTNFSSLTVTQGINILKYNGTAWSQELLVGIDDEPTVGSNNLVKSGGVFANIGAFDISEYNKSGSTLATYADLTAALAALPSDFQKGGMSIKFVQSSDNKYVQYRLKTQNWSINESDWENLKYEICQWAKTDNQLYGGIDIKGRIFYSGHSIFVNVTPGDVLVLLREAHSAVLYSSDSPSEDSYVMSCNPSGDGGVSEIFIPDNVYGVGVNYIQAWSYDGEVGYKILKAVKSTKIDVRWEKGGMDNGIPNFDPVAIHSVDYLEIIGRPIGIRRSSSGVAFQFYNANFEYVGRSINNVAGGFISVTPPVDAKYCRICLFFATGSQSVPNTSKDYINSQDIEVLNLVKYENNQNTGIDTVAFKATYITSGQVIYSRQGEGVLFEIQLIGAYAIINKGDSLPNPHWPNFYRNEIEITADDEIALKGTIYDLCGLSSQIINDTEYADGIYTDALINTPLFDKNGLYSGIVLKFQIPYYNSISVKITGTNGTMWGDVKSYNSFRLNIPGITIPYGARFHGVTSVKTDCQKGEQVQLMNTQKNGVLLGINLAGKSTAFDWVEGCLRAFKYGGTTQQQCTMLSSGIEDYLCGAFGYNVGEIQKTNYGCTMRRMRESENYRLSGYRNHFDAPIVFGEGGFKVTARWGDQNKANWDLSSTDNFAGGGNPGTGILSGTAFYYDWE